MHLIETDLLKQQALTLKDTTASLRNDLEEVLLQAHAFL
jgi:hypothetical protein